MPAWWRSSCGSPCRDGSVFTKNKNAGLTSSVFSATIYLAFAGVAHLVERDLAKVEVASSSLVARSKNTTLSGGVFFVCASALTVVSAGCRRLRFSAYCAIFRVVMTRKWGRRTRFRQNNRYFAFFLAMEKSMWYTDAEYNSECAGGLHRCGLGAPLLRAVAGNVCTYDRDPVHRRRRDIAAPHGGLTEPGRRP